MELLFDVSGNYLTNWYFQDIEHITNALQLVYYCCADWKSHAESQHSCTVQVWIIGLCRSRTRRRWQEGITDHWML